MQYFAAPVQYGQQTTRASQYRSKKRKRDGDAEETDDAGLTSPEETAAAGGGSNSLDPSLARVAGLLPQDEVEIPQSPFPHAAPRPPNGNFRYSSLQQELAELDPPLYDVNVVSKTQPIDRPSETPALRQRHLGILTTTLHRCLLQGDYRRAGRAWGLMLRSHVAGRPIDVRSNGRWGIGAELLLHRNTSQQNTHSENIQHTDLDPTSSPNVDIFSPEGFDLAREYYERLIVQYPNRKQHPNAVDALTFYPVMFSLWIYEICERSRLARRELRGEDSHSGSSDSGDSTTSLSEDTKERQARICADELAQAKEVSDRTEQLVTSPPFDKRPELLLLRGMIGLWKADLIIGEDNKDDDGWSDLDIKADRPDATKIADYERARTELQSASAFFSRAQEISGRPSPALKNLESDIRKLTEKIRSFQMSGIAA